MTVESCFGFPFPATSMPPTKKYSKTYDEKINREKKKWKEQKLLKAAKKCLEEANKFDEKNAESETICRSLQNSDATNSKGQSHTISIAIPGSILDNAQSPELRTYLAGQIARAACIYCVDEVIVFDDICTPNSCDLRESSCFQLAKLLQYLECPQYLRKLVFPLHRDLQYVGLLNPLDAPHHLRLNDEFPYREGVVTAHQPVRPGKGSFVNVGLLRDVTVDKTLVPGIRVTVKLLPSKEGSKKKRSGVLVPPSEPKKQMGVYWGYTVRLASCLSDVMAGAPYAEGYDLTFGTSDKGSALDDCNPVDFNNVKHALIVLGGLQGLEAALEIDENLNISDVSLLFDKYVNTCPNQGSRTIRTEEALLISLAQILPKINASNVKNTVEV